ncbi:MAG: FHA domain-containing protein [Acidobacteria bacterium]|nr:FHA domain-containing protein [Acidobacteriota bacterium]
MKKDPEKKPEHKREEALPERLLRRMLEGMGSAVDRGLGRGATTSQNGLTTTGLVERMKHLIDERVRNDGQGIRIAPHFMKLKVEWGTHAEAPPEIIQELEHEVLAAAIDYINDNRYTTLAPVQIASEIDIFTSGVSVDPTFGEFEQQLKEEDEAKRRTEEIGSLRFPHSKTPDVQMIARLSLSNGTHETPLIFTPGGRRMGVGRGTDSDLHVNDRSVSKIHATLMMNREGTLLVADTGSTNGTFINGRRIGYGEARQIQDGDVVGFGDIEVRFRKKDS